MNVHKDYLLLCYFCKLNNCSEPHIFESWKTQLKNLFFSLQTILFSLKARRKENPFSLVFSSELLGVILVKVPDFSC